MTASGKRDRQLDGTSPSRDEVEETQSLDTGELRSDKSTLSFADVPPGASTLPGKTLATARSFGRYKILKELGGGGMGKVYLAHDGQLDRNVALKIPRFKSDEAADIIERFYREARAMAALRHQNLCTVYDVGEIDGIHFLTMAYIEGYPLSEVIKTKRAISARSIAALIRKLALALHQAHRAGVVHRDLKPANIIIGRDSQPVVVDFGLAWREEIDAARLTGQGSVAGTPAFMSPDQVQGQLDSIGPASDIYSLGVILYQLLAGRLPFQGNIASLFAQILRDEPRPPSEICPEVDPTLEMICLKALAKAQDQRFSTMEEVAAKLADYLKTTAKGATATVDVPLANEGSHQALKASDFVVLCPVCATRVETSTNVAHGQVSCPQCHTAISLRTSTSKPVQRRESEDSDDQAYRLAAPTEVSVASVTFAEEAVAAAQSKGTPEEPSLEEIGDTTAHEDGMLVSPWTPSLLVEFLGRSVVELLGKFDFVLRWLVISVIFYVLLAMGIALVGDLCTNGIEILTAALLVVGPGFAVVTGALTSFFVAIFEDYANGRPSFEPRPLPEISECLYACIYVLLPFVVSITPGLLFSALIGFFEGPMVLHSIVLTLSVATFFPLTFLSAMHAEAPYVVVSPAIVRTLQFERQTWMWFYVFSVSGVILVFLLTLLATKSLIIFIPLALGALCLSPLTYFQLLGRLYYRCQQAFGLSR